MSATILPYALTTLDTAKIELAGLDPLEDAYLTRQINEATDLFNRAINRTLHWRAGYQEKVRATDGVLLVVRGALPIDSITSITHDLNTGEQAYTVEATSYAVEDAAAGLIKRTGSYRWISTQTVQQNVVKLQPDDRYLRLYEVTYDGGYVTPQQALDDPGLTRSLPYDIEGAIIDYCRMKIHQRLADPTLRSVTVDRGNLSWVSMEGTRVIVPGTFKAAVSYYKTHEVV